MNQRGEITLFFVMCLVLISGLLFLCSLELRRSYLLMQKRTELILCTKEIKGELHRYLVFMGRTNWGIKNSKKIALVAVFIPGLQGLALNLNRIKEVIKLIQVAYTANFLNSIRKINQKCMIDPRIYITPFHTNLTVYKRDYLGGVIPRRTQWTYYFASGPYLLSMKVILKDFEAIHPQIHLQVKEKLGKLSSLWSRVYY